MKYTFEIMKEYEDAFKGISVYSVSDDKKLMVDFVALEELEDAQKQVDEAYQRGFESGKEVREKGCEGCEYEEVLDLQCNYCLNRYHNQWTAKQTDDEIKVGDEVRHDRGWSAVVTSIDNDGLSVMDYNGEVASYSDISKFTKTGRHFDIDKILEAMKE